MARASTSLFGLSRDLWYKLGGILLVALVIAAIAYSLASASQAAVPPTAETFASDKKCTANEADAYGCYPGKGEGWCAARGACINRMDAGLADDKAFAKQCDLDDTTTAAASTASTKTVTEVDTTVTTKAVETDTAVAETATATESERTDATGGACCLGDSGKAVDDTKPAGAARRPPATAPSPSTARRAPSAHHRARGCVPTCPSTC